MNFKQAYLIMQKGYDIKLPEWGGFWRWINDTIMIYTKEGEILDIRETTDVNFTIQNTFRTDWMVVNK